MAECTAARVADALTRSFEGYVMPVNVSARGYEGRFPDKPWSIPQIVPEELAPAFFARCGWEPMDTNQLKMVLDLSQRPEGDANG